MAGGRTCRVLSGVRLWGVHAGGAGGVRLQGQRQGCRGAFASELVCVPGRELQWWVVDERLVQCGRGARRALTRSLMGFDRV